jgi:putative copper export protein
MNIRRALSRLVLTAHIITSVGWLGAVMAYLALDIVASASEDIAAVRAAYFGMDLSIRLVIVPLAIASVLIGTVNALTSSWGLFRHYWVLVKLLLTIFATVILLLEVQNVTYMAELASTSADPRTLPGSLLHSIGGLVVLITVAVLSVYKPKGLTPRGWRKQLRSNGGAVQRTSDA